MEETGNISAAMARALAELSRDRAAVLSTSRELRAQGETPPTSEQLGRALLYQLALTYAMDDRIALAIEEIRQGLASLRQAEAALRETTDPG